MKDKGGKIVLVSSGRGDRAMENIAPYCTTKSAVMGMVRALAVDLAQYNIKVNGIAPGYVMTPMVEKVFAAGSLCKEPYSIVRLHLHGLS